MESNSTRALKMFLEKKKKKGKLNPYFNILDFKFFYFSWPQTQTT